jgi:type II restriction enzyme
MAPTARQALGELGERLIVSSMSCPRCKRQRTLRQLRRNFKCADVICDFCGFLAQVKTNQSSDIDALPSHLLGGAWAPTKERIDAGLYFPLYLVLVHRANVKKVSVWYLSADLQPEAMYVRRNALSPSAKRAGWQGFLYDLTKVKHAFVRLA